MNKIKKFVKDHDEEIIQAAIMITVCTASAVIGASLGYKQAEHDLELVYMKPYYDDAANEIIGVGIQHRNGKFDVFGNRN